LDEPEEYIDFMAKYRDWISIRRIGIRPETKPEEVVQYLAGIRTTIDVKSYPMLGIKTSMLDDHANKISAGMRKSYSSLAGVLGKMDGTETKRIILESCSKELAPIAETYLLGKIISNLGFDVSINQKLMSKVYPDLKPPKALGRHGKGKKEE
jgi:hypothetical protein